MLIHRHYNLGEGTLAASVDHPSRLEVYWGPKKKPRASVGLLWPSLAEGVLDQVNSRLWGGEFPSIQSFGQATFPASASPEEVLQALDGAIADETG